MFPRLRCVAVRRQVQSVARGTALSSILISGLAGCSADVTRFDGAFGLTESPAATHATSRPYAPGPSVADAPPPAPGYGSGGYGSGDYASGYNGPSDMPGSRRDGITVSSLPEASATGGPSYAPPAYSSPGYSSPGYVPPAYPAPGYAPASPPPPPPYGTQSARPPAPVAAPVASPVVGRSSGATGQNIEVQPGDTVSSLARKHNVPIADLMQANDLRSPALRPGQRLVLPSAGSPRAPLAREAAAPVRPAAAPASVPTTTVGRDWTGTHTLKPGESLYGIARQAGVKVDELQRANGITDVHKLRPGMVLKVPGAPSGASVAAASPAASEAAPAAARAWSPAPSAARVAAAPPAEAPARSAVVDPSAEPARLRIINGSSGTQVASAPEARDTASDAARLAVPSDPPAASASPKAGGTMKLRWPVRGKIIASFGRHADGAHNDGVNVQAPAGTDVLAAEAGVVAYAGSEVKGYGNLVLVRHDNGWVTAYAHNDTLLVQRGDRVRRGQALGKVGMTGSADQPQLHFELRQGSKPVDPMPYMEKL